MIKCLLAIPLLFCVGCVANSDAYYQAQVALYNAQTSTNLAIAANAAKDIGSITLADGTVFKIANQATPKFIKVGDGPNPYVEFAKAIIQSTPASILAGGWALGEVTSGMQGNSYSSTGDMSVTKDSGNTNSITSTTVDSGSTMTQQDYADSGNSVDSHNSDSHNTVDSHNETATPTVVTTGASDAK